MTPEMTADDIVATLANKTLIEQKTFIQQHAEMIGKMVWDIFPDRKKLSYRHLSSYLRKTYGILFDPMVAQDMTNAFVTWRSKNEKPA